MAYDYVQHILSILSTVELTSNRTLLSQKITNICGGNIRIALKILEIIKNIPIKVHQIIAYRLLLDEYKDLYSRDLMALA